VRSDAIFFYCDSRCHSRRKNPCGALSTDFASIVQMTLKGFDERTSIRTVHWGIALASLGTIAF
jgi:hypothetical protein